MYTDIECVLNIAYLLFLHHLKLYKNISLSNLLKKNLKYKSLFYDYISGN